MTEDSSRGMVLVVDDDRSIRALLRALLTKMGFQVAEAQDGTEAIAKIHDGQYQLVLLDLMMPNQDGFAVVRHLRDHYHERRSCVIVMTAASERETVDELDDRVVYGVLRKPFDLTELGTMVDNCARAAGSGDLSPLR